MRLHCGAKADLQTGVSIFFTRTMDQLNRWTVWAGAANTLASAIMLIS